MTISLLPSPLLLFLSFSFPSLFPLLFSLLLYLVRAVLFLFFPHSSISFLHDPPLQYFSFLFSSLLSLFYSHFKHQKKKGIPNIWQRAKLLPFIFHLCHLFRDRPDPPLSQNYRRPPRDLIGRHSFLMALNPFFRGCNGFPLEIPPSLPEFSFLRCCLRSAC